MATINKKWTQWFRGSAPGEDDSASRSSGGAKVVQRFGRFVLLVAFFCFALLLGRNVSLLYRQSSDFDFLTEQAFKEMAEYERNPSGKNPAERWWRKFREVGERHSDPEIRMRATGNALVILRRLKEYSTAAELVEGLGPTGPGVSAFLPFIRPAYQGIEGSEQFVSFVRSMIEDHPDKDESRQALLFLGRRLVADREYEKAAALLRAYSDLPEMRDSVEVQSLQSEITGLREGMKLPRFSCSTVFGDEVSVDEFLGEQLIILFWSPSCGPSRQLVEAFLLAPIPHFSVLYVGLAGRAEEITQFLREGRNEWLAEPVVCVEGKSYSGPISSQFNVFVTPTAFFINDDGTIMKKARGQSAIRAAIQAMPRSPSD